MPRPALRLLLPRTDIDDHEARPPQKAAAARRPHLATIPRKRLATLTQAWAQTPAGMTTSTTCPTPPPRYGAFPKKPLTDEAATGTNNEAHMTPLRVARSRGTLTALAMRTLYQPPLPQYEHLPTSHEKLTGMGSTQRVLNQDPNADADHAGQAPDRPSGQRLHDRAPTPSMALPKMLTLRGSPTLTISAS